MRFDGIEDPQKRAELQLSASYGLYLAGLALAVTYWPLYFEAMGFAGAQIGLLFSVRTALNIVAQPVMSGIADATGRPIFMLRAAFLWGAAMPGMMLFADRFWMFAAAMWMSGLLTGAIAPLLDAAIVRRVGAGRFGDIRLWGSVGYGVMVLGYGLAMQSQPKGTTGYGAIIGWVVFLLAGAAVAFRISRREEVEALKKPKPKQKGPWITAPLVVLLLINALHWWGITAFNIYISLHASAKGFGTAIIGMTVATAIVGEVLAFAFARRLVSPHFAHWLLPVVYLSGALRWWVTAAAPSGPVLIATQLIHFLSFGLWTASLIHLIGRFVSDDRRAAAQGLMGGLTLGIGGMVGNAVSGALLDIGGGVLVFRVAAGADVAACLLLILTWRLWSTPAKSGGELATAST